jgi:hypothetical protein
MPHSARVAHHIHGRLRLQVSDAKGIPRILNDIGHAIRQVPEVKDCRINTTSGSVVIHYDYDPDQQMEFENQVVVVGNQSGLFQVTETKIPEFDDVVSDIKQEAKFASQHSEAASKIINGFAELNERVKRLTNNFVDLNVLLPLGLAALAFAGLGLGAGTPLWVTLAIFSFHSFLALHSPLRINYADSI